MKKTKKQRRNRPSYLLELAAKWPRFNYEATSIADRKWLYSLRGNFVNCSIAGPCSPSEIVKALCEQAHTPVLIKQLSSILSNSELIRGVTAFGSFWDKIDARAQGYPNMRWWISDHQLIMKVVDPPGRAREFYEIAGNLILKMRERYPESSRFSPSQWLEIASTLDEFGILELLPKKGRAELADWNQKNGKRAIHTLSQALKARQPVWLRREALRVLYRSLNKFQKTSGAATLSSNTWCIYA